MNRKAVIIGFFGVVGIITYGLLDPQTFPFPKCPFRSLTGWLCPGCGSQRAIHQFLHGQFWAAFQLNALFIPAIVYALTGYCLSLISGRYWPAIRQRWYGTVAAWAALILILAFWLGRNLLLAL